MFDLCIQDVSLDINLVEIDNFGNNLASSDPFSDFRSFGNDIPIERRNHRVLFQLVLQLADDCLLLSDFGPGLFDFFRTWPLFHQFQSQPIRLVLLFCRYGSRAIFFELVQRSRLASLNQLCRSFSSSDCIIPPGSGDFHSGCRLQDFLFSPAIFQFAQFFLTQFQFGFGCRDRQIDGFCQQLCQWRSLADTVSFVHRVFRDTAIDRRTDGTLFDWHHSPDKRLGCGDRPLCHGRNDNG